MMPAEPVYGLGFTAYTLGFSPHAASCLKPVAAFLGLFLLLFSSCLQEEDPLSPPTLPGDVQTVQIPMGKNYDKQFFFDLGTNRVVSANNKASWDLAFECGFQGYRIFLNSSKLMFAWNTLATDFSAVTSDAGAVWKWDVPSGNPDSTAIGQWGVYADGNVFSYRHIYLIHRGKDSSGSSYGVKKVLFGRLLNGKYTFKFANLDGTDVRDFEIIKDNNYSFMYFSFDSGGLVRTIAPEKTAWDLQFTMYTHIFSETPSNIPQPDTIMPYLVTGVLQNSYAVAVAEAFNQPFADITLADAAQMSFEEDDIDVIGYDWKLFNFDEGVYDVLPGRTFIIRDTEGYLYKLRFTDFYNSAGEKGYPKFEFQRL